MTKGHRVSRRKTVHLTLAVLEDENEALLSGHTGLFIEKLVENLKKYKSQTLHAS